MKKLFAIVLFVWPLSTLSLSSLSFAGNHSGIGPGGTPITTPVTGPKGPVGLTPPAIGRTQPQSLTLPTQGFGRSLPRPEERKDQSFFRGAQPGASSQR